MLPKCEICKNEKTAICNFCSAIEGYKFEKDPGKKETFWFPPTTGDMMYNRDMGFFSGGPKHIYSRKQYKRLLKKEGLVDATIKDCKSIKPKTERDHKPRIKQFAKKLTERIHKEGAMPFVMGRAGKDLPDKIARR